MMLQRPILSLALVVLIQHPAVLCDNNVREKSRRAEEYTLCPTGKTFSGQLLHSTAARSSLDCLVQCSLAAGCVAVNVCPAGQGGLVDCDLLSQINRDVCGDLQGASHPSCFFAQKVCQNGGRPKEDRCACRLQFAGEFCERYIRDCTEAFNNGWQNADLSGPFLIQPVTAPSPFMVRCIFRWGGVTVPFQRYGLSFRNMDWPSAKGGYGEDLQQLPSSRNFFVGLENLHHLTMQAKYTLHVSFYGGVIPYGHFYDNFTIGPESTSYELTFRSHRPRSTTPASGDIFDVVPPAVFCTQDRDTGSCAQYRGAPGWYGAACDGYSLFADDVVLPVNGTNQTTNQGKFLLGRANPVYVDQ